MKSIYYIILILITPRAFSQTSFQWAFKTGGANTDYGTPLAIDLMNNVYATGTFSNVVDFDPGPSTFTMQSRGWDIFVSKSDALGNVLWAKDIRTKLYAEPFACASDNSNNVLVTGYFVDSVDFDPGVSNFFMRAAGPNTFILKLDANGNFIWAHQLKFTTGSFSNYGNDITTDPSGNIIVTGSFQGTIDFDPGPGTFSLTSSGAEDIYVLKLDPSGNFIWARRIGSGGMDYGNCLDTDASGNICYTGVFSGNVDLDPSAATYALSSSAGTDMFLSQLDVNGNFMWAGRIGGSGAIQPRGIISDPSGDIYTTGYFQAGIDFDPGTSIYNLSAAATDIFILKLNSAGNFLWVHSLGSSGIDAGNSVCSDGVGNIYVAGEFQSIPDFDPGPSTYTLNAPVAISNPFVMKLNSGGNFVWANSFSCGSNAFANSVAVDVTGAVYTSGYFNSTLDADPSFVSQFNIVSSGAEDCFIQKMSQGPAGIETKKTDQLLLFPNPNNGTFYMKMINADDDHRLKIYDVHGKLLKDEMINGEKIRLDAANGIYFYRLYKDSELISSGKFLIE